MNALASKLAPLALVAAAIIGLSTNANAGYRCFADRTDHVPLPAYSTQFCDNHQFVSVWTGNGDLGCEAASADVNRDFATAYNDALAYCVYLDNYVQGCYVTRCEYFDNPSSHVSSQAINVCQ